MENPLGQRLRELPGPLLLTGHTGFKGTWMTFLLEHLNVPVVGYSLPAESDSLYQRAARTGAIPEVFADIRDYKNLESFIDLHQPSTIIHMAAQPLVLKSYESPRETFDVNVMGTVNVLDVAFKKYFVKAIIVVTTDKVYRNENTGRAFIEKDPLEGKDPYSASKVGTESVVAAWQQIVDLFAGPKVASVRAGNVIGGGDFARDRLIPDLIRGALTGNRVEVRNPYSTRPWQHVLDPLAGYLKTLEAQLAGQALKAVNFGPKNKSLRVIDLISECRNVFPELEVSILPKLEVNSKLESNFLDLDSNLAMSLLDWEPKWSQEEAIARTFKWWRLHAFDNARTSELCLSDIQAYLNNKHVD